MDKAEVQQTADFLVEIDEGLCEYVGAISMHLYLTQLYRVVQRLMNAMSTREDQDLKVVLAALEGEARLSMQSMEGRLGMRN